MYFGGWEVERQGKAEYVSFEIEDPKKAEGYMKKKWEWGRMKA